MHDSQKIFKSLLMASAFPGIIQKINLRIISDTEELEVRKTRIGYVSQFFRTIPRVTTMNIVIEPLIDRGWEKEKAISRAAELFRLFDIPKNLWDAFPSTFSGGEKQRINIMRTLIDCPELLLLDEPTASLDKKNRSIIKNIIMELKKQNVTMIGIFHDPQELESFSDEVLLLERPDFYNDDKLIEKSREILEFVFQV